MKVTPQELRRLVIENTLRNYPNVARQILTDPDMTLEERASLAEHVQGLYALAKGAST